MENDPQLRGSHESSPPCTYTSKFPSLSPFVMNFRLLSLVPFARVPFPRTRRALLPCLSFLLVSFSHVPYTFVFLSNPLKVSLSHVCLFPSLSCPSPMSFFLARILFPCPLHFCFPLISPKSVSLPCLSLSLVSFSHDPSQVP